MAKAGRRFKGDPTTSAVVAPSCPTVRPRRLAQTIGDDAHALSPADENALTQTLGADFREVNIISVPEQLEAAATLFDRLALAIRKAAAVAGLAGLLVRVGAIAAGVRERAREAARLK